MKKIVLILSVILFITLFPISALADNTVSVEDYGFSVSMPQDYLVLTRDKEQSASVWELFTDEQQEQLMQYYLDNNVYVNAIAPDVSNELVVLVINKQNYKELHNLNAYKDDEILEYFSESFKSSSEAIGLITDDIQLYKTDDFKFFYTNGNIEIDGQTVFVKTYATVVNGIFLQCNFRSYTGPLSKADEETIKSVVDSIKFKHILKTPYPGNSSSTFNDSLSSYSSPSLSSSSSSSSAEPTNAIFSSSSSSKIIGAAITAFILGIPGSIIVIARNAKKKKESSTVRKYICSNCGKETTQWINPCPFCGTVNSVKLITIPAESPDKPMSIVTDRDQQIVSASNNQETEKQEPEMENKEIIKSIKNDPSLKSQLRELKALLDEGLISEEEYSAKKKQLLGL